MKLVGNDNMKSFLNFLYETDSSDEAKMVEKHILGLNNAYSIRARKKSLPANVIVVEIDNPNRILTLYDLEKLLNGTYDPTPVGSLSSIGCVKVGNVKILVKTKGLTGSATAGLQNEQMLIDAIKHVCNRSNPINILFIDEKNTIFNCLNVYDAISVGKDTTKNKKADIILKGDNDYRISLKKDSAEFWCSCDKYANEAYEKLQSLIQSGDILLIDNGNGNTFISPTVAYKMTKDEAKDVIFGSDIVTKNDCVIQKTFTSNIILLISADTYKIDVTHIIRNMNDVDDSVYPWFYILNATSHTLAGKIRGIRLVAIRKNRISKNIKII